jgi:hypothetical protein
MVGPFYASNALLKFKRTTQNMHTIFYLEAMALARDTSSLSLHKNRKEAYRGL